MIRTIGVIRAIRDMKVTAVLVQATQVLAHALLSDDKCDLIRVIPVI